MHRFFFLRFFAWGSACIFYLWAVLVTLFGSCIAPISERMPSLLNGFKKEIITSCVLDDLFKDFEPSLDRIKEDLQRDLIFSGINERPDSDKQSIYFQLHGSSKKQKFKLGQKIAVQYAKTPEHGSFSYDFIINAEGLITVVLEELKESEALFSIMKKSEKKEFIISHVAKELPRLDLMLSGQKVDNGLLIKQKARWIGKDLILFYYGGDLFSSYKNKERIDFEEHGVSYTSFVQAGDYLIRKDNQWILAKNIIETDNQPILFIQSINENIMICELWDAYGLSKIIYTLVKFKDSSRDLLNFEKEVYFVGMQSFDRPIIAFSNGKRIILDPSDWLLKEAGQWKKISTIEALDAYIERRSVGPLFVFEKIIKENKRLTIKGSLFNDLRSKSETIFLEIKKTGDGVGPSLAGPPLLKQQKEREKA